MKIRNLIIVFSATFLSTIYSPISSLAQDIHFSQHNMVPVLINPSNAGTSGSNHRAFLSYKNQWRGFGMQGATFNTALFSYDAALLKNKWQKGYMGAGLTCFRDVAGDLKLGTTQISLSFAGVVFINEKQSISGGLQGGYVQKSFMAAAMNWENQYNDGTGTFNSSLIDEDFASAPPSTYANFSTGISWNYTENQSNLASNDQRKMNIGLAIHNASTPIQNFIAYGTEDELYTRFVIHSTALVGIKNTNFALTPNFLFSKQGPSYEINVGTSVRWMLRDESKYTGFFKGTAFSAGAQYRLNDAIVPVVLLEHANYAIGMSYDINVSRLSSFTSGKGGFELSIRFLNPNPFHSVSRVSAEPK